MLVLNWHPITHDFGLIHAPLDRVVDGLLTWHHSIGIHYRKTTITGGLESAFKALLPLAAAQSRRLFVQTLSEWTACYQNGIDGSDPFPAMSFLAKKLEVLAMRVCSTPPDAVWPGTAWEVYAPPSLGGELPLGSRRAVSAINDGGRWTFDQAGDPYEFENVEMYKAKKKRERFTKELMEGYLSHFGIRPFDDSFFMVDATHPAIMLEQTQPVLNMPEFTLEEVIAGVPWQRGNLR